MPSAFRNPAKLSYNKTYVLVITRVITGDNAVKMKVTRKRPGKKIEEITALQVLDNQGKNLAYILFNYTDAPDPNLEVGAVGPYHIIISTQDDRLWIDVLHPSNDGEWSEHPSRPR